MNNENHPSEPIDAIIFDCDGTLSHIEGIDELAIANHVGDEVQRLTAEAMGRTGINPHLYQQRLDLVQPTVQQIAALADQYYQHKAPDLLQVLQTLKNLDKAIYVVSAGLYPAVADFAFKLNLPKANVYAVDIYFDDQGRYQDFDHHSPLVTANGKRDIAEDLRRKHSRLAYVGDGLNDVATQDVVTRFIGYGGAYYRENIKRMCQYYISIPSMLPLLSLCLTEHELLTLC